MEKTTRIEAQVVDEVNEEVETAEEVTVTEPVTAPAVSESKSNKIFEACKKHGKKILVGAGCLLLGVLLGKKMSSEKATDDNFSDDTDVSYEDDQVEVTEI